MALTDKNAPAERPDTPLPACSERQSKNENSAIKGGLIIGLHHDLTLPPLKKH